MLHGLIAEDRKQDVSVCMCSGHPFVVVTVFQNKRNIAFVRKQVLSYFRVFAKGRLQLLLITTIVLKSPYFKFTCNRERTIREPATACMDLHREQRTTYHDKSCIVNQNSIFLHSLVSINLEMRYNRKRK